MILRPWDWAGAYLILSESGGYATDFDKMPLDANEIKSFVCGNRNILEEFYGILKS